MLASSARVRGVPTAWTARGAAQSRVAVLRRCSPADVPSRTVAKTLKPGLISIAGNLHVHVEAVNVHLINSNPSQAGQPDPATTCTLPSDPTAAAAAAAATSPPPMPVPAAPPAPDLTPYSCIGRQLWCSTTALAMWTDGHRYVCGFDDASTDASAVALRDMRRQGQRVVPDFDGLACVQAVAVSADCTAVVVACYNGLWLWDVGQGDSAVLLSEDSSFDEGEDPVSVNSVAITPDGRYAVSGGCFGWLRVWDLRARKCIGKVYTDGEATSVAITGDGRAASAIVSGLYAGPWPARDTQVRLWKWSADLQESVPGSEPGSSSDSDSGTDSDPDSDFGSEGSDLGPEDPSSGFRPPVVLRGMREGMHAGMSVGGRVILACDADGCIRQWDPQTGAEISEAAFNTQPLANKTGMGEAAGGARPSKTGLDEPPGLVGLDEAAGSTQLNMSGLGKDAALEGLDEAAGLVGMDDRDGAGSAQPGKPGLQGEAAGDERPGKTGMGDGAQPGKVCSFALSPDGQRVQLGHEHGIVTVWDVQGKACLGKMHGHGDHAVDVLAVSVDGRHAASFSGKDQHVCIWYLG